MTLEEIKETTTMPDLLSRYGIEVKRGMCRCPFHGSDRHPSMKVFKDGANCFTCGWNGDVIKFVQNMDNCDFKTAFYALGGNYQHEENERKNTLIKARLDASKHARERMKNTEDYFKHEVGYVMDLLREGARTFEPLSDEWIFCKNKLPFIEATWEMKFVKGEEVNEIDVLRVCREVRQVFSIATGIV